MIKKIGLTGGIGSGKSSVAEILTSLLGCAHIDADEICRKLLELQAEGWKELFRIFGPQYITKGGHIDRGLLRKNLFADKDLRLKINRIIHPLVKNEIMAQMERIIASESEARVLVEVPLLYEVGWENLFDIVVVVYADYGTCLSRLMDRDGIDEINAAREMESQLPLADKVMKADHVIDNSGTLPDTAKQVKHLAELLRKNSGRSAA